MCYTVFVMQEESFPGGRDFLHSNPPEGDVGERYTDEFTAA